MKVISKPGGEGSEAWALFRKKRSSTILKHDAVSGGALGTLGAFHPLTHTSKAHIQRMHSNPAFLRRVIVSEIPGLDVDGDGLPLDEKSIKAGHLKDDYISSKVSSDSYHCMLPQRV